MALGAPTTLGLGPGFGPDNTATTQDQENQAQAVAAYGVAPGVMGTQVGIGFGVPANANIGVGFSPGNTQMTGTPTSPGNPMGAPQSNAFDDLGQPNTTMGTQVSAHSATAPAPGFGLNADPVDPTLGIDLTPGLSLGTSTQTSPTGAVVGAQVAPGFDDYGIGSPLGGFGPSGNIAGNASPGVMGSVMDQSDMSGITGATEAPGPGTSAPGVDVAGPSSVAGNTGLDSGPGFGGAPAATSVEGTIGGIAGPGGIADQAGMGYGGGMLGGMDSPGFGGGTTGSSGTTSGGTTSGGTEGTEGTEGSGGGGGTTGGGGGGGGGTEGTEGGGVGGGTSAGGSNSGEGGAGSNW